VYKWYDSKRPIQSSLVIIFKEMIFIKIKKKVTLVYKWPELYETSLTNGCLNILRKVVNFLTLYPNLFLVNFQLE
jgi:hypothetical protein